MSQAINKDAAGTHVISSRPCRLESLIVNGGVMGSITIYDNASVASGAIVATIAAPLAGMSFPYVSMVAFGVVVVLAANTNITVVTE
jgi:hypothetical protein